MTDSYPQSRSERIRFERREEAKKLVLKMAQQARLEICILGQNIDQVLFDNESFIEFVSQLARRNSRTRVRVLVHDTMHNVQNDHRLIALAQKLTSSIYIHNTARQHRTLQKTQLLIDDFAYLICPRSTQYQGSAALYDRLEVRQLKQEFNDMWDQSSTDISIRHLSL